MFVGITSLAIAESINSNEVLYDNSNSNNSRDNVQDALDDICKIIDYNSVGFSLLTNTPTGLSSELIDGLYRYQGTNTNNYICFGTNDKETCTSDLGSYMYRIVGIDSDGRMKLIKKEALSQRYAWDVQKNVDWVNSDLYIGLNGNYFLDNTIYVPDTNWSNKIAVTQWHYLTTTDSSISTIGARELSSPEVVNAKIGVMYIHDYADSLVPSAYSRDSWIYITKNDIVPDNQWDREWTITRYNGSNTWYISGGGMAYYGSTGSMAYEHIVRPVFFLRASERIASGTGTITDPYILE